MYFLMSFEIKFLIWIKMLNGIFPFSLQHCWWCSLFNFFPVYFCPWSSAGAKTSKDLRIRLPVVLNQQKPFCTGKDFPSAGFAGLGSLCMKFSGLELHFSSRECPQLHVPSLSEGWKRDVIPLTQCLQKAEERIFWFLSHLPVLPWRSSIFPLLRAI